MYESCLYFSDRLPEGYTRPRLGQIVGPGSAEHTANLLVYGDGDTDAQFIHAHNVPVLSEYPAKGGFIEFAVLRSGLPALKGGGYDMDKIGRMRAEHLDSLKAKAPVGAGA